MASGVAGEPLVTAALLHQRVDGGLEPGAEPGVVSFSVSDGLVAPVQPVAGAPSGSTMTVHCGATLSPRTDDTQPESDQCLSQSVRLSGVHDTSKLDVTYVGDRSGAQAAASATVASLLTPAAGAHVSYPAGWNLVGGPAGTLFTGAAGIYTLGSGDLAYQPLGTDAAATAGRGYWVYFPTATTVALNGAGSSSLTIMLPAGKAVLIGNPSGTQQVHVIGADLVLVYDPTSGRYHEATVLQPGQGAWAFSASGATITLSAADVTPAAGHAPDGPRARPGSELGGG